MGTVTTTQMLAGVLSVQPAGAARPADREAQQDVSEIAADYRSIVAHYRGQVVRSDRELLATFHSVSAALIAGLAIQRQRDRSPTSLTGAAIRVGIDSGDVLFSGNGCSGNTVENAVRLSQAAAPGEVRLSRLAHGMLGNRYPIVAESVDRGVRVAWAGDRSGGDHPLPPALDLDHTLLVGRQRELEQLLIALDATIEGKTRWLSVVSDAGVGKTRLISELARHAQAHNIPVLYGIAEEGTSPPYAPVVQALRCWIEAADDMELALAVSSGKIACILPELEERLPDLPAPVRSDAETERRQLFESVAAMLHEITAVRPAVLILDSLQWEGDPSFEMLREVLAHISGARLLIITTHRTEDHRTSGLLRHASKCLGADAVDEIILERLSEHDVATVLASAGKDSQDLAAAVHMVTGGLPLHLAALLGNEDALAGSSVGLPGNVRDALRQRLESLPEPTRKVVEAASVLGDRFTALELAQLTDDSDRTFEILDQLSEEGIFRVVNLRALSYQFVHSIMREVALSKLGGARAARLHERAGLALEACGELERDRRVFDLARHFTNAAALGNADKAVAYSSRAAQQALDQHANEDAALLFQDTLDLLVEDDDERTRCELEIGCGRALNRLGKPEFRELLMQAADRAHAIGDGELMARALLSSYRGTFSNAIHVDESLVRRMRDALDLLAEDDTAARARLTSHLAVELVWAEDRNEAQSLSAEAVRMAEALRDTSALTEVLAHHQWSVFHPLSERIAIAERLNHLAREHPDPRLKFEIAYHEIFTGVRAGNRADYDRALAQSIALAAEIDEPSVSSLMLLRNATAALMSGQFADAAKLIEERRNLDQVIGSPDGEAAWRAHNFWLRFETQERAKAQEFVRYIAKRTQRLPRNVYWAPFAAYAAEVGLAELGKPVLTDFSENGFRRIPMDQLWLCNLCQLVLAAAATNDVAKAENLNVLLEPHKTEHANSMFMTFGSVARYIGLISRVAGRLDDAESLLREAIAANQQLGAVTWVARCQLDLAEILHMRNGIDEEAQALTAQTIASASDLGLPCVLARAQDLIARQSK